MIEISDLSKSYKHVKAVDGVTFKVEPGKITGFLGPNGAGKSTTMRMVLGLDRPDSGSVKVNGHSYRNSMVPIQEVGALLEPRVDKGRSARNHLRAIAATAGISDSRVDEVLELVGLTQVAKKPAGSFSLGMGQRLGIAAALLADPKIVMLDEPVNGLDPDGVLWIRHLLKSLAASGKAVFLSSHLMSEMELTADHLVVIGKGRLIANLPMSELIRDTSSITVEVSSSDDKLLRELLAAKATVRDRNGGGLVIEGLSAKDVGNIAFEAGVRLQELHTVKASLESAYMRLTSDSVTYRSGTGEVAQ